MFCLSHCLVFLPSVWGDPRQELRAQQTSSNFYCPTRYSADYLYYLHEARGLMKCADTRLWWIACYAWLALGFPLIEMSQGWFVSGITDHWGSGLTLAAISPPLPITNEWLTLYLIHSNTPCKECKWIWGLSDLPFIELDLPLANKARLTFSILQWSLLWLADHCDCKSSVRPFCPGQLLIKDHFPIPFIPSACQILDRR